MRIGAILAALLAAAVPLWVHPSSIVAAASLAAGVLLVVAVVRWSVATAAAGGGVAIAAYALALWSSSRDPAIADALLIGLALVPVVQYAAFGRAFRGAEVAPPVFRLAFARWLAGAAAAAATVAIFAAGATLASLGVPPVVRPLLAGSGALLALWAVLAALRPHGDRP